ncbi:unnamed protein product [Gadus morhua 'NCC']
MEVNGAKRYQIRISLFQLCKGYLLLLSSPEIQKLKDNISLLQIDLCDTILKELQIREQRAVDTIKTNLRYFYSFAKRFAKAKSNAGPLKDSSNTLRHRPQDMANILQEQFYSAFSDPESPDIEQTMRTPQDMHTIEDVQRISGTGNLDYWERHSALNLLSLQRRKERYMIIHVWKILNETTPNDIGMQFTDNMRLRKKVKIPAFNKHAPLSTVSLYDSSFAVHAGKLWNILPHSVTSAAQLDMFKILLGKFLHEIPDKPSQNAE